MQSVHSGFNDPNNLKFENITILGVPYPPKSVSFAQVGATQRATVLPASNIEHDGAKEVNTHMLKQSLSSQNDK